ncbi:pyrroloquinoline quinone biosynthesis protein PqqE [uncultured Nevskia sp.]|uniref:pyrroloquinoline quinone biosynthesis protein PqqE n=1 Tax=uncultured Nevskia sp. TaxID=228950 RepID=UPI002600EFA3|nr:pyrroloquinoline quinone biosynthesis protein PqqE [uncultured Nevskia sp.]
MPSSTSAIPLIKPPLWLLAELTYACPLQCAYCSNPVDYAGHGKTMDTETWLRVLRDARQMGALQLGLSGGEPLVRQDLEVLVTEATKLGYYSNLITSGIGMDAARARSLKVAGLDHIQVSFQSSEANQNDEIAGMRAYAHKVDMARAVKAAGFPMVLCFVLHRDNLHRLREMLDLAIELEADYVELATTQYYGWALLNRDRLLPTLEQVREAEIVANEYQARLKGKMDIYFVVPDYYEKRPKPCMNGWGSVFLLVTPDGTALPCHAARQLPGFEFPNVQASSIKEIWQTSDAFNRFRGNAWMKEPCASCPEKEKDFGGCRCQAFQFTGDAAATDPVCDKSPLRHLVDEAISSARITTIEKPIIFRNPKNSDRHTIKLAELTR